MYTEEYDKTILCIFTFVHSYTYKFILYFDELWGYIYREIFYFIDREHRVGS